MDKAVPCLVRAGGAGPELLVFRHPRAGVQIPKGTVEPGESTAAAALRELEEETGVREARIEGRIGAWERIAGAGPDEQGEPERHVWHVFRLGSAAPLPTRWPHTLTVAGPENGLRFECHWLPLRPASTGVLHPLFVPVFCMVLQDVVGSSA